MEKKSQLQIYRSCKPVIDAWYEPESDETITEVLADAIASISGVETTEMVPLYETIDMDAVIRLFEGHTAGTEKLLSFTVDDWNVFIRSDGRIRICDGTRITDPAPVFESYSA